MIQKGLVHERTVREYGLGFVVDSFEEAADMVRNISEEEYYQLVNNIKISVSLSERDSLRKTAD